MSPHMCTSALPSSHKGTCCDQEGFYFLISTPSASQNRADLHWHFSMFTPLKKNICLYSCQAYRFKSWKWWSGTVSWHRHVHSQACHCTSMVADSHTNLQLHSRIFAQTNCQTYLLADGRKGCTHKFSRPHAHKLTRLRLIAITYFMVVMQLYSYKPAR